MTDEAREQTLRAEALADFLRELRHGVEAGLDPLAATQAATESLPTRLRNSVEAIVMRLRGE